MSEPEETLSRHVPVRFPADMIAAATRIASAEGMTVSAWIRREVERETARREGYHAYVERELNKSIDETAKLRALVAEILTRIEQLGVIGSKNDEWRERAGLETP